MQAYIQSEDEFPSENLFYTQTYLVLVNPAGVKSPYQHVHLKIYYAIIKLIMILQNTSLEKYNIQP